MLNLDEIIGSNLQKLRVEKGFSQRYIGNQLSVPVAMQQISKYENGSNRISAATLYELAVILDCPIIFFFKGIKSFKKELEGYMKGQSQDVLNASINLIEVLSMRGKSENR